MGILLKSINSLFETSAGSLKVNFFEKPNIIFIHERKKKVGPTKYRKKSKNRAHIGNRSKKKEKNNTSDIKNIEPGKPKKSNMLSSTNRNNLGQM
jgi:hypothetical protein|tara:strand:- start:3704 stop:3988 length:285 start_codon:yes stop_codon:yes gene_type:complete